jgi:hypothetical protein
MITHSEFAALRLKEFCAGDRLYIDEEDEHGDFIMESIRGIDFARHSRVESGTLIIYVDLLDYSTDAGPAILQRVGLSVTRRSTLPGLLSYSENRCAARLIRTEDTIAFDPTRMSL